MKRRFTGSSNPARALSIAELRHMAARRLPPFVFEYLDGGAENEVTLTRNRAAFNRVAFRPLVLVDVEKVDLSRQVLGRRWRVPFAIGPTGFNGLIAPDGDRALARAARAAHVPMIQSTVSNTTIEEMAAIAGLEHWLQVYVFKSDEFMQRLLERARAAGVQGLVLTVDGSVFGNREWDKRNYRPGTTDPILRHKLATLAHPRWGIGMLLQGGIPAIGNIADMLPDGRRDLAAAASWAREQIDPSLNWRRIDWLRRNWDGPLVIKGIARADDARRALDAGAQGLVVSNHGGRQLDGAQATINVLPDIAAAVGGQMTILIDSGFLRGTDIAKALALGADAVLLGRAALYGLGAAGEQGVARSLALLEDELRRTLAQLGCPNLESLGPELLDRGDRGPLDP
ncbi:MAG: alpha-hydroxy-acid oxidizing protein [Pararhodobacter sp.]|nr:alpha-hydroxy-acid oxidizing protein [Pararhodobacter sp.]